METAWLIEYSPHGRVQWFAVDEYGDPYWTTNPSEVVRFSRRADAESMRKGLVGLWTSIEGKRGQFPADSISVTEHAWCPPMDDAA